MNLSGNGAGGPVSGRNWRWEGSGKCDKRYIAYMCEILRIIKNVIFKNGIFSYDIL